MGKLDLAHTRTKPLNPANPKLEHQDYRDWRAKTFNFLSQTTKDLTNKSRAVKKRKITKGNNNILHSMRKETETEKVGGTCSEANLRLPF